MDEMPASRSDAEDVTWRDGVPTSSRFEDMYFSVEGGLAETRHVFLAGSRIPERWRETTPGARRPFTIGELGFGTGLNFLATALEWERLEPASDAMRLHYVAFERYPLGGDAVRRIAATWPELSPVGDELARRLPTVRRGVHRIDFASRRIALTLVFGDVRERLEQIALRADAWFLDGFAPSRNPEMWTEGVLAKVAAAAAEGATVATYTVAGFVRRGLEAAGFDLERRPGYGRKREALAGRLRAGASESRVDEVEASAPWFVRPALARSSDARDGERIVVVGAGIAGCAAAERLARRGFDVTVVDRDRAPAGGASGNPHAVVMPVLTHDDSALARFTAEGFALVHRWVEDVAGGAGIERCGVVQLPRNDRWRERLRSGLDLSEATPEFAAWLDRDALAERCGSPVASDGVWFPGGAIVDPRRLCEAALDASTRIRKRLGERVAALRHEAGVWTVLDSEGGTIAEAPAIVWAAGFELDALPERLASAFPVRAARGQIALVPATTASRALRSVVCRDGYVLPERDGMHLVGATYDRDDLSLMLRPDEHTDLVMRAKGWLTVLDDVADGTPRGRASIRAESPDKLPLVGPAPDVDFYASEYGGLHHGRPYESYPPGRVVPGLWMSIGHGSRGFVTAVLAAELLASEIAGEPLPVDRYVLDALHPARFLIRDYRRAPDARRLPSRP